MTTYATYKNMEPYNTTLLTYDGQRVATTGAVRRHVVRPRRARPTTVRPGRARR